MIRAILPFGIAMALASAVAFCHAAQGDPEAEARKALEPRTFTFSQPSLPLDKALAELTAKTGNRVADTRKSATNPALNLPKEPTTFWQALDAIGRISGVGFSAFGETGVALTDAPYRAMPTAYAGIFRIARRRVAVIRDDETDSRQCQLAFDVTWEPRFQPFYVDLKLVKLTFAPDAKQKQLTDEVRGRGRVHVAGRSAIEFDAHTAAPDRTCPKIALLEGTVWALGPSRMVPFTFDKLALQKPGAKDPPRRTEDGVTVTILSIKRQTEVLLVKLKVESPKGAIGFDSHESWLDNNRIMLTKEVGGKQRVLLPTGSQEERQWPRAEIEYAFTETEGLSLPASLDGWTLRYEAPGRIVEVTAKFKLENLALP